MKRFVKVIQGLTPWVVIAILLAIAIIRNSTGSEVSSVSAAEAKPDNSVSEADLSAPRKQSVSEDGIWRDVVERPDQQAQADRLIIPDRYRLVAADIGKLDATLSQAPLENSPAAENDKTILSLPLPDGTFGRFEVQEYLMMEPGLADRLPEVKTYLGWGIDDPSAVIRLDRTPAGFHGMILAPSGTIYIDPYSRGDIEHYISYYKRDYGNFWGKIPNEKPPRPNPAYKPGDISISGGQTTGPTLRTYRLAVAATVEYTTFHGGQITAQAAIVTTINRVTGIYEREFAVRLTLVANNINVVFTSEPDGYTDGDDDQMVNANQAIVDGIIGNANYDVGHVFGVNGAGIAGLGAVCSAVKAEGVSQLNPPMGDPFDVDYVAHEMGHQFGANHSYNASGAGGCTTRNAATAWEPASGITIMSYVGICQTQDLAGGALDSFHSGNFDEIVTFVNGAGNACAQSSATGNGPPVVDAGPNRTIPEQTPFTLSPNGAATDPDADTPTYSWEEFDTGPAWTNVATLPNSDSVGAAVPIFRSYNASNSSFRTFPIITNILDGSYQNIGESLPTIARTMNFRATVRDNKGGVSYDSLQVTVANGSGPFRVTKPTAANTWTSSAPHTVTWDVASTNTAPVSCANVVIALATDGGANIPYTPLATVPNTGSALVTLPATTTTQGRISVTCADNIFFDISNGDFNIQAAGLSIDKSVTPNANIQQNDTVTFSIVVANTGGVAANNVQVTDNLPAGLSGTNLNTMISLTAGQSTTLTLTATVTAGNGTNITNIAAYQHTSRSGQDSISFTVGGGPGNASVYLPVILLN